MVQSLPVQGSGRLPALVTEANQDRQEQLFLLPRNYPEEVRCAELFEDALQLISSGMYNEALALLAQICNDLLSSNNNDKHTTIVAAKIMIDEIWIYKNSIER
jgi:hypothetical protein